MLAGVTQCLTLRSLAASDLETYRALYTDSDTMRFIGTSLTAAQAERSFLTALAGKSANRQQFLVAELGEPAVAIALCGLTNHANSVEVGIIMLRAFRGRDLARSTVRLLVSHAFEQFTGDWICVDYDPLNLRAARLFASLGFAVRSGFAAQNSARSLAWVARDEWWRAPFNQ